MVISVETPRRSIRKVVFDSVLAYHGKPHGKLRLPSAGAGAGEFGETAGLEDDEELGVWEEEGTVELVELGAERTKNVLILMSDTGGGHRASAEPIRDAFRLEFGDEYKAVERAAGSDGQKITYSVIKHQLGDLFYRLVSQKFEDPAEGEEALSAKIKKLYEDLTIGFGNLEDERR